MACLLLLLTSPAQAQNTQLAIAQAAVVGATTSQTTNPIYVRGAVADAQGNTYFTGIFGGTVRFGSISLTGTSGYDVFVAKRDPTGTYLWAVKGGGLGSKQVLGLAVDATGDVVVTGYFDSSTISFGSILLTNAAQPTASLSNDVFVAKLSGTSQTWQWAVSAGGSTRINGDDKGQAVTVDVFGSIYVAGTIGSSVAFFGPTIQVAPPFPGGNNIFLAKLTSAGQWVWVKGQDSLGGIVGGLSTDTYGDVYLTGAFGSARAVFGTYILTTRRSASFVAKVNGAGVWQWATSLQTSHYARHPQMYEARSDGRTGVYVAGSYVGDSLVAGTTTLVNTGAVSPPGQTAQTRTSNGYVGRLHTRTGTWQWLVQTEGLGFEYLAAPQLDGGGHVLVAGGFGEPTFFSTNSGNSFGTTKLHSMGGADQVVAQLDTAGRWQWARQAGSSDSEGGALYGLDAQGRGLLFGSFEAASVQLGMSMLLAYPGQAAGTSSTAFTARLGANGPLAVLGQQQVENFIVYPNPAHTTVTIAGLRPGQVVQVLDVLGRTVLTGEVPGQGDLQMPLPAGLPVGLYLVRAGALARHLVVE